MTKFKFAALAAMTSAIGLATAGCVTDPNTGEQRISRAAIGGVLGAGSGYLLGDLIGGRRDRTVACGQPQSCAIAAPKADATRPARRCR